MIAIETHDLCKTFGRRRALSDLSLAISEGSVFGLLGRNGAGKSTTLHLLLNLASASAGSSSVLAKSSPDLSPEDFQHIGYVSPDQKLHDWMKVGELIRYCKAFYRRWDDALSERLRKRLDLSPTTRIRALSRGQRIKLQLLIATSFRPRVLVIDELFSSLDPVARDQLKDGLFESVGDEACTILLTSHEIDDVEPLLDKAAVLVEGVCVENDDVDALQERFRRIEAELEEPVESSSLGRIQPPRTSVPNPWIRASSSGRRATLTTNCFEERATVEAVRKQITPVHRLSVAPMSLREIFSEVSRTAVEVHS